MIAEYNRTGTGNRRFKAGKLLFCQPGRQDVSEGGADYPGSLPGQDGTAGIGLEDSHRKGND